MRNPGIKDFFLIWRKNILNVDLGGGGGKHIYIYVYICIYMYISLAPITLVYNWAVRRFRLGPALRWHSPSYLRYPKPVRDVPEG